MIFFLCSVATLEFSAKKQREEQTGRLVMARYSNNRHIVKVKAIPFPDLVIYKDELWKSSISLAFLKSNFWNPDLKGSLKLLKPGNRETERDPCFDSP